MICLRRVPKQQRSRERLELILDATAELLAEVGPDGTTITTVAEKTGLATSSIYDYVEGDRELIGAVAERGLDRIHEMLVETLQAPSGIDELVSALSHGLREFLQYYQDATGLREALAFADADPVLMEINLADTRRNAALIAAAVAPARPNVDLTSAVMLVTHCTGTLAGLVARVDRVEAEVLIEQYERMVEMLLFS